LDGDVVDVDPALGEQFLDIAVRKAEAQVPADRQHDQLGWEAEAGEGRAHSGSKPRVVAGSHASSVAASTRSPRMQQRPAPSSRRHHRTGRPRGRFRSLQESIDTTTPGGKLVFHVFAALAKFERDLIRGTDGAGLKAARARGRQGGRPPVTTTHKLRVAQEMYRSGQYSGRRDRLHARG
jgi:hypothetical protein